MSTIINATTTNGVVIQPDNSGSLVLQTNNGTTALTIDTSQRAAFVAGTAALPAITTTGDTNTGMFFPAADTIAFAEGGAEAMRIDSSGRITTPYQPAFHANCNGTTQLSGTTLLFQTVATNIGNNYNSSTSTFTAPIAGTYYIYGATMANTGTGRLYWRFAKNGSFFQVSQAGGDSTNYGEWFGSMTVTLAASDSIFMYLDSGTPYGGNGPEQYFGGYLLG